MSHYKPYLAYKDSGVEWLGRVPEHWLTFRFSRVIERIKDGTHGSFERTDTGYPLLSAKNVGDGILEMSDSESQISEADHREIVANGFPKKGDLLLTIVGTIGRSCIYPCEEPLAFQRSVCFIRLRKSHFPKFFYYLTQSKFFQEQIQSKSKASAQAGIYMGDVSASLIGLPSYLAEQQAISNHLDHETTRIDALVDKKIRFMGLLREKRQTLITNVVTKGLDPSVKMKDSGVAWLGEVPEHWDIKKLKYLCNVQTGSKDTENAVDNGKYPFFVRSQTIERINTMAFDCEAILTAGDGVGVGKVFHYYDGPFDFHQRVYMMSKFNDVSGLYLFHYFKEHFYKVALDGGAKSTVDSLRRPVFTNFPVCVPPKAEQSAIVITVQQETTRIDTLIQKTQHSIDLLKERRAALITAAVTGQIDLREAA